MTPPIALKYQEEIGMRWDTAFWVGTGVLLVQWSNINWLLSSLHSGIYQVDEIDFFQFVLFVLITSWMSALVPKKENWREKQSSLEETQTSLLCAADVVILL